MRLLPIPLPSSTRLAASNDTPAAAYFNAESSYNAPAAASLNADSSNDTPAAASSEQAASNVGVQVEHEQLKAKVFNNGQCQKYTLLHRVLSNRC